MIFNKLNKEKWCLDADNNEKKKNLEKSRKKSEKHQYKKHQNHT